MNYVRVNKNRLSFKWWHRKGFWSRCTIVLDDNLVVAEGPYQEMEDLLTEIRLHHEQTTPVDLDFKMRPPKPYDGKFTYEDRSIPTEPLV